MSFPLPVKWKQSFYRLTMLFRKRKQTMKSDIKAITSIYNIAVPDIDGVEKNLSAYQGLKILLVNVASECGYTPQYADLQLLHEQYKGKLAVLGFPTNDFGAQEPGTEAEIKFFCTENYNITFPLFSKIKVIEPGQHPIYKWLTDEKQNGWNSQAPQWNFWKYLVDEKGNLINYFSQHINPFDDEIISQLR
jgi:glutathione peroxidase